jgi:hypothetical protein
LALELEAPLGFAAMKASREATVVVAEAEGREDDGAAEADDEPVSVADGDVSRIGLSLTMLVGAGPVEDALVEGEPVGEGVVGEGVGVGDGEGVGEGEGDGDAEGGSARQTTFAVAAAFPCGTSGAASALPSRPRVRKPPLSRATAVTRTCPKRIRIACSRSSPGLPCAVRQFGDGWGPDGYLYSYPLTGYICIMRTPDRGPARHQPARARAGSPLSPM